MATFPPVFSLGRTENNSVYSFSAGSTAVNPSSPYPDIGDWIVGDHVWTADDANDSKLQYRGTIASITEGTGGDTGKIVGTTVTIAAAETCTTVPRMWKSTDNFVPTLNAIQTSPTWRRSRRIDTHEALDATVWSTQIGEKLETMTWTLILPRAEVEAWWTFVADVISDGADLFTLSWYDTFKGEQREAQVKLMNSDDIVSQPHGVAVAMYRIELAIQTEGTYL